MELALERPEDTGSSQGPTDMLVHLRDPPGIGVIAPGLVVRTALRYKDVQGVV